MLVVPEGFVEVPVPVPVEVAGRVVEVGEVAGSVLAVVAKGGGLDTCSDGGIALEFASPWFLTSSLSAVPIDAIVPISAGGRPVAAVVVLAAVASPNGDRGVFGDGACVVPSIAISVVVRAGGFVGPVGGCGFGSQAVAVV